MPQVIELKSVCRSFGKKPDLADRIATAFGAKSTAKLLRAVDGVDLAIEQGEVLGLVGESGCGKSTLGRLVISIAHRSKETRKRDPYEDTHWCTRSQ